MDRKIQKRIMRIRKKLSLNQIDQTINKITAITIIMLNLNKSNSQTKMVMKILWNLLISMNSAII